MKLEYNKDMQKNKFKMFNLACLVLSVIFVLGILWLWKINNNDNKSKNTKADKLIVQFDQLKKISNINNCLFRRNLFSPSRRIKMPK